MSGRTVVGTRVADKTVPGPSILTLALVPLGRPDLTASTVIDESAAVSVPGETIGADTFVPLG